MSYWVSQSQSNLSAESAASPQVNNIFNVLKVELRHLLRVITYIVTSFRSFFGFPFHNLRENRLFTMNVVYKIIHNETVCKEHKICSRSV